MSNVKLFGISLIVSLIATSCSLNPQAPEISAATPPAEGEAATSLGNNRTFICGDSVTLQTSVGQPVPTVPTNPRPNPGSGDSSGC
jgi:hypothetical protein